MAAPAGTGGRAGSEPGGVIVAAGADLADNFRQAGVYVGKILKGANLADLPVEQPAKFPLVKTADVLGLTVPITLLGRADEVLNEL